MTSPAPSPSRYLGPALSAIGVVLAGANWTVEPERSPAWIASLVLLACFTILLWRTRRSSSTQAAGSIQNGVVVAALIVVVALATTLAHTLGAIHDGELSQRLSMVIVGAFFVFTGNALPKTLTPLSALSCDGATAQALQRFVGWTLVLAGLALAVVWLVLPLDAARLASVSIIVGGAVAVTARLVRARTRRTEA